MPLLANAAGNAAAEAAAREAALKARGGATGAEVDIPAEARALVTEALRNGRKMNFVDAVNQVYKKHGIDPAVRAKA